MIANIVSDLEEKLPEAFIKTWLKGTSEHLSERKLLTAAQTGLEVSLVFLKEGEAKRLNWKYRGRDYPTDILSFENDDADSLGELVFCWTVLQKQAKEHELPLEQELGYLMIHGLLHLLGHDHEIPGPKAEKMLKIQDEIFELMISKPKKKAAAKVIKIGALARGAKAKSAAASSSPSKSKKSTKAPLANKLTKLSKVAKSTSKAKHSS
jgi:probable rRNA maturation factor